MKELGELKIRKAIKDDLEQIYQFEREYIIEHENDQLSRWDPLKSKNMEL